MNIFKFFYEDRYSVNLERSWFHPSCRASGTLFCKSRRHFQFGRISRCGRLEVSSFECSYHRPNRYGYVWISVGFVIHLGFEFWWAFHSQLRSSLARRCNRIHREVAERYTVCLLGRHVSTLHSTHHISTFRLFRQGFCPSVCTSVRSTDIDMSWTCPTCRKRDLQWYILIYFEPTSAVDFFDRNFRTVCKALPGCRPRVLDEPAAFSRKPGGV